MRFERGFISPHFVTDMKTQKVEFEDPLALLHEKKISNITQILPILEKVAQAQRPFIIIAEDVDGDALATLVVNKLRGGLKVAAVKAPGFVDNRKAQLEDMAVLLGAEMVSEETGSGKLEDLDISQLGTAKTVTIVKDETVILDGAGDKSLIEYRCDTIRQAIENTSSDYEADKMKERLAKLGGGVAVIKVGGASEVEVGEIKDRFEDALCATRAALEEGIVPGGGSALLYAGQNLESLKLESFDQQVGVDIVKAAVKQPCVQIATNAGVEGAVVVQTLLKGDDKKLGFNAQTGEYVNMVEAGIIDPTKVIRSALVDAASVASLMTTTEALIVHEYEPPSKQPAGGGGMGGMG